MQLDSVTAVIRPRQSWEAIDLGFAMVRRWWRPMYISWIALTLPTYLALTVFLPQPYWVTVLLFWWSKPLWERVHLHIVSHALFGELPTVRQTLRSFNRYAWRQLFASLSWRRFSPSRSMDLPVTQLETLSGTARQRRLAILHHGDSGTVAWLSFIGMHVETILACGLLLSAAWFLPDNISFQLFELSATPSIWFELSIMTAYYAAITLVAPFYVAGGFALYLNRRIQLEAWDIEVAFRTMLQKRQPKKNLRRKTSLALTVSGTFLLAWCLAHPLIGVANNADLTQQSAKKSIERILDEHPDFNQKETIRIPSFLDEFDEKNKDANWFEDIDLSAFGTIIRFLVIASLISAVLVVLVRLKHLVLPMRDSKSLDNSQPIPPTHLLGLDLRMENLPQNVAESARTLSATGDHRGALGLLFRASLAVLLQRYAPPLRLGHTESECLQLTQQYAPAEFFSYLSALCDLWVKVAYAHLTPDPNAINTLCDQWSIVIRPAVIDE